MAKRIKKGAFIILRIEESFKKKLVSRANAVGETISEFVRKLLIKQT